MSDQSSVVPFGKYKGQPIEALANDPQYVKWFLAQPGIEERYPQFVQVVVNNFSPAEDSPDHNALVARFLNPAFARAVLWICAPKAVREAARLDREVLRVSSAAYEGFVPGEPEPSEWTKEWDWWEERKHRAACDAGEEAIQGPLARKIRELRTTHEPRLAFEYGKAAVDVALVDFGVYVEAKPTMGDDFPTVMRKVARWGLIESTAVVLIGEYTGRGADLDAVRAMFATARIQILTVAQVEAEMEAAASSEAP